MPHVLYLRGCPGTGKNTIARILERELGWPRLWVHHWDSLYRVIGDYKVPDLTDRLMRVAANYLMEQKRSLLVVRPSRQIRGMDCVREEGNKFGYTFIPVRLTATYETMLARVESRQNESPFRVNTREGLDEYLNSRKEEEFIGESVIETDKMTAEEVAAKIRELIPSGS
jgi:shikimate kinase